MRVGHGDRRRPSRLGHLQKTGRLSDAIHHLEKWRPAVHARLGAGLAEARRPLRLGQGPALVGRDLPAAPLGLIELGSDLGAFESVSLDSAEG